MRSGLNGEWYLSKWERGQGRDRADSCTWNNAVVAHSHLLAMVAARAALARDSIVKEMDLMEAFSFYSLPFPPLQSMCSKV